MSLIEISDKAIGQIFQSCEQHGYALLITADHGNAEQMISPSGGPHTAHTTNRGIVIILLLFVWIYTRITTNDI